jgi:hypothetical protein
MMYAIAGVFAGALVGMWYEYYSGKFEHLMRRISRPSQQAAPPRNHEDFIDDCEQFNRAMITVPVDQRVFEVSETIQ